VLHRNFAIARAHGAFPQYHASKLLSRAKNNFTAHLIQFAIYIITRMIDGEERS